MALWNLTRRQGLGGVLTRTRRSPEAMSQVPQHTMKNKRNVVVKKCLARSVIVATLGPCPEKGMRKLVTNASSESDEDMENNSHLRTFNSYCQGIKIINLRGLLVWETTDSASALWYYVDFAQTLRSSSCPNASFTQPYHDKEGGEVVTFETAVKTHKL
ncbi:hypothetical protein K505DRAFT_333439 [Melanomma pulvis-pyrius CBS 109.77]|uniref:Uncharacterized protein n=1 Tax=Melanomma pulvis-pyrius CBS 109.77 TaxID=1314802 RepID=A0A6A6XPX0_9PLEO|nr:hypothetical protein K505DRAFT_333439 [Melanomma pulvis-pyrius CBS 109.77]